MLRLPTAPDPLPTTASICPVICSKQQDVSSPRHSTSSLTTALACTVVSRMQTVRRKHTRVSAYVLRQLAQPAWLTGCTVGAKSG